MRLRLASIVLTGAIPLCQLAFAGDFWKDKPYEQWERAEVERMLSDSPWARVERIPGRARSGSRVRANNNLHVRFATALPVRQAMARYCPLSGKTSDDLTSNFLNLRFPDHIVVELEFLPGDRQSAMEFDRFLRRSTTDSLRLQVFLVTEGHGRIELAEYKRTAPGRARFVFGRLRDGRPIVSVSDGKLDFEFQSPSSFFGEVPTDFLDLPPPMRSRRITDSVVAFSVRFTPRKMVYQGKLAL